MGAFTGPQRSIIAKLGLDPSEFKAGYERARAIQQEAQQQMQIIDAQRQRLRIDLEKNYTAEQRKEMALQLSVAKDNLSQEIQSLQTKTGAARAASVAEISSLNDTIRSIELRQQGYTQLIATMTNLGLKTRDLSAASKEAGVAAAGFKQQALATGEMKNPFEKITEQLNQMIPGLGLIQGKLGAIFSTLTLIGGGIQGGSGAGGFAAASAGGGELVAILTAITAGLGIVGVTGLGVAIEMGEIGEKAGEAAHAIELMAQKTGIAAHDLQVFQAIGKLTGLTLDDVLTAQRRLSAAITGTATVGPNGEIMGGGAAGGGGSSKGPALLAALEIPTKTATGAFRDSKDVLEDLADVFVKLPDGAEKSRIAIEVLGRAGLNLVPFLNLGKKAMQELRETFEQFMPDLDKAADLHRQLDIENAKWDIAMTAVKTNIAENVLPVMVELLSNLNALAGLELQDGSILKYLLTGKMSDTFDPNANQNILTTAKSIAGAKPFQLTPGAAEEFRRLVKEQREPIVAPAVDEFGNVPDLAATVAQDELRQNMFKAAAAQIQSGRIAMRANLPGGGATLPALPKPSEEEIAAQILLNEQKIKTADAEKQIGSALADNMKKVDEILGGEKNKSELQQQAETKSLALAGEMAKMADTELSARERVAGSMKGYAAATDFLVTAEEKINDALAGRDVLLERLGFKAGEAGRAQAKALFAEMSAPGTLPSDVPGLFAKHGVPFAPTKESNRDLEEALKLTQQSDALRVKQESSLAIIQRGTDEYVKQNAEIADQNQKISDLTDKQDTLATTADRLNQAESDLTAYQIQQVALLSQQDRLMSAMAAQTDILNAPASTVDQRAAAMVAIVGLQHEELEVGKQIIAVNTSINAGQAETVKLRKDAAVEPFARPLEALKSKLATGQESAANALPQLTIQQTLVDQQIQQQAQIVAGQKLGTKEYKDQYDILLALDKVAADYGAEIKNVMAELLTKPSETIKLKFELGLIPPDQALKQLQGQRDELKQFADSLGASLKTMEAAGATIDDPVYAHALQMLAQVDTALKTVQGDAKVVGAATGFGALINDMKDFSSIASAFSGGISKVFSEAAATFTLSQKASEHLATMGDTLGKQDPELGKGLGASLKALFSKDKVDMSTRLEIGTNVMGMLSSGVQAASGGQGIMGIFAGAAGLGDAGKQIGQALGGSAGAAMGGPIGASIGAAMGVIGLAKQMKQRKAALAVARVEQAITVTMQKFQAQQLNLKDTIAELQNEKQQLLSSETFGKKGNSDQVKKDLNSLNSQIISLQQQQKQILDSFTTQLATFRVPPGVQSYAATLAEVAKQLKDAAGAGATAAQQAKFLDDSMAQLKITIGKDLNSEEQKTVDLMRQSVDLVRQRALLVKSEADQERQIRVGLGQARALTPAQQAAQQLRDLRKSTADQLAAIDEQQGNIKAQLDGQMQLFGWTQKDLDASDAKTKLIALQLSLQKQLTQETVNQIQAQMVWYAQLAKGLVPNLPPGYLPQSIFAPRPLPPTYNMPNAQIVLNVNGSSGLTADQIAQLLKDALTQLNTRRAQGLQ